MTPSSSSAVMPSAFARAGLSSGCTTAQGSSMASVVAVMVESPRASQPTFAPSVRFRRARIAAERVESGEDDLLERVAIDRCAARAAQVAVLVELGIVRLRVGHRLAKDVADGAIEQARERCRYAVRQAVALCHGEVGPADAPMIDLVLE